MAVRYLPWQKRIAQWVVTRLGVDAMDSHERALRFIEEAFETVQVQGLSPAEVQRIFKKVYSKPPGNLDQEFGGVLTTLLAWIESCGLDHEDLFLREMRRIETLPTQRFRDRQNENAADGTGKPLV